jgi:threonyl-tRNA synthetase
MVQIYIFDYLGIDFIIRHSTLQGESVVREEDMKKLEAKAADVCKQKYPFQRLVLSKDEALEMFSANPFKSSLIR